MNTNTCEKIKPSISEFADGTLNPAQMWEVQTHLAQCAECARLSREIQNMTSLLRALPTRQTSAQFEERLAERLTERKRLSPPVAWLQGFLVRPQQRLRPALALGTAMAALTGVAFYTHLAPSAIPANPSLSVAADSSLVMHCVEQHQTYVAAQPLSDPAAQNLVSRLDGTAASQDIASSEDESL